MDIALLDQQQTRAGKPVAFVAEIDLLFSELAAQAFFMDAAPAARPAADAARLGRIEHPAAEVAVHAARGDPLALHGDGARLGDFSFHPPNYGILYSRASRCLTNSQIHSPFLLHFKMELIITSHWGQV